MHAHDIVIVGAGPYGLSLAAHVRAHGLACTVLGTPMEHWERFMPPGMLLRSEACASSISAPGGSWSFAAFCASHGIEYQPVGSPVPISRFVDYARWFRQNGVGAVLDTHVARLERDPGGFRLLLGNGEMVQARRVILANGLRDFRQMPDVLAPLPESHVSHSCQIGSLVPLQGQDVTIVGGGQSALGLAALLHEQGTQVRVLARRDAIDWNLPPQTGPSLVSRVMRPESGLGSGWRAFLLSNFPGLFRHLPTARRAKMVANSWGPSGAWWLRDRIEGKVEVLCGQVVVAAATRGEGVALVVGHGTSMREILTGHVIAATGFKTDMRRLGFLAPDIVGAMRLTGGAPELDAHFQTSIPGLYAIGQASAQSFGPVMRFVCGTSYASEKLAQHLCRTNKAKSGHYSARVQLEQGVI